MQLQPDQWRVAVASDSTEEARTFYDPPRNQPAQRRGSAALELDDVCMPLHGANNRGEHVGSFTNRSLHCVCEQCT